MAMDLNFDNLDTNKYCRYYVVHAYLVHTGVGHTANTSKHLLLSLEGSAFIIIFSSYSLIFQIPNSVKCIFFLHSEIPKSVRWMWCKVWSAFLHWNCILLKEPAAPREILKTYTRPTRVSESHKIVFVQIAKCTSPNCQMYLSKLKRKTNGFVKYIAQGSCISMWDFQDLHT